MLLIQIARDLGKALEERLYQSWGGKPSAAMLRHTDCRLPRPTKDRYRSFLSSVVPGLASRRASLCRSRLWEPSAFDIRA